MEKLLILVMVYPYYIMQKKLAKNLLNKLNQIKSKAENLKKNDEEELMHFREKLLKTEDFDLIQSDWFALVQELSARKLGLRHYDPQLLAGLLLSDGKVIEMKTGEGKTLASTLAISYQALEKKGVHAITVNDYLAERDQQSMGKLYKALGLTSGLIKSTDSFFKKKQNYKADITYVTNSEVVFDYLRDSNAYDCSQLVQRPFSFCIIDEIDSILIDEARTPLIISAPISSENFSLEKTNLRKLVKANLLAQKLEKDHDFIFDEKTREVSLTANGYQKACSFLQKISLYDVLDPWILSVLNSLKANYAFKKNKDYIVLNNKVSIIDEFTGRIMEDRRWSLGLHEAIEIKENLEPGVGNKTKISITYQNFFPLYPCFTGMSGTAKNVEKELQRIYKLDVVVLPTLKPIIRKDFPDVVFLSQSAKWKAVLKKAQDCFQKGQPILIGTTSIEKSEFLSELFHISKIPHNLLNAKPENLKSENQIIAQAGQKYAVTIATNMAGRGTDILLGGNLEFRIQQEISKNLFDKYDILEAYKEKQEILKRHIDNLPYSLSECHKSLQKVYHELFDSFIQKWKKENQEVKNLGGLFVLGTERHENRRIDDQLRGRAGRQGDPGSSQFFISLDDELLQNFGGKKIKNWITSFLQDENIPLESNSLTKSIRQAQEKLENQHYEIRKNIFDYDEILNFQRIIFFSSRQNLLLEKNYGDLFLRYQEKQLQVSNCDEFQTAWIENDLNFSELNAYSFCIFPEEILQIIDDFWTEHIEQLEFIRDTITWKSYGMQNPLNEYNLTAFLFFKKLFTKINFFFSNFFLIDD